MCSKKQMSVKAVFSNDRNLNMNSPPLLMEFVDLFEEGIIFSIIGLSLIGTVLRHAGDVC